MYLVGLDGMKRGSSCDMAPEQAQTPSGVTLRSMEDPGPYAAIEDPSVEQRASQLAFAAARARDAGQLTPLRLGELERELQPLLEQMTDEDAEMARFSFEEAAAL